MLFLFRTMDRSNLRLKRSYLKAGIGFEEGKHSSERILQGDLVVKSPGIESTVPIIQRLMLMEISLSLRLNLVENTLKQS